MENFMTRTLMLISLLLSGAIFGFCFGLFLTMVVNVPMNEALAAIEVPGDIEAARRVWDDYSPRWQFWNQTRTVLSGISFLIALGGVMALSSNHVKQDD